MKPESKNSQMYKIGPYSHVLPGILSCVIVLILLFPGCKNHPQKKETATSKNDSTAAFILKKVRFDKEVSLPGELLPLDRADIYAKVSGYLKTINVDIGDAVKKGDILAVLEAPELVAGFAQNSSDVQAAKSKYAASLDAWKRISKASNVKGTVAEGELDKIKNQMIADSSAYESVKSKLDASAQLKDYLTIRAPFNGVVTQRNADPGTLVGTSGTKPVFVIEDNSQLRLRLPVPEDYTSESPEASKVVFTVDAYPEKQFEARLSRKSGEINVNNRTEIWEFRYPNETNMLKAGMYANAVVKFERNFPTFLVPSTAISTTQEKRFVIRLKDGKAQWINVRNGSLTDNKTEIFGDLNEGDTLLTRGTDEVKEGTKIIAKLNAGP